MDIIWDELRSNYIEIDIETLSFHIYLCLKPSVHIIATIASIAIAQKEFSDQNDCMETVRLAIVASQ